jgi:hypothetical protein
VDSDLSGKLTASIIRAREKGVEEVRAGGAWPDQWGEEGQSKQPFGSKDTTAWPEGEGVIDDGIRQEISMVMETVTASEMYVNLFRVVFWVILPCKMIVDRRPDDGGSTHL